jgi:hypothetical protein
MHQPKLTLSSAVTGSLNRRQTYSILHTETPPSIISLHSPAHNGPKSTKLEWQQLPAAKLQYFLHDEQVCLIILHHTTLPHTIHTRALEYVADITAKMKLGLDRALREPVLAAKSPLCKSALSSKQMHKYP